MIKKILFYCFLFFSFTLSAQQESFNLISWNIRDFGKTKNAEELEQIAEILRDADLVALQEVVAGYGGAQAVARLADLLNRKGSAWDYAVSDPTQSPKYVTERYAYLWKTSVFKIRNRGKLVKNLVKSVDREPFLLRFYKEEQVLTMLNFHSRPYNQNPEGEIEALTRYALDSLSGAVLLAGDFNVSAHKPVFSAFKNAGFSPALNQQKTTLKRTCEEGNYLNYAIDNILFSPEIQQISGGVIDFVGLCDRLLEARNLSDHLPVQMQFGLK